MDLFRNDNTEGYAQPELDTLNAEWGELVADGDLVEGTPEYDVAAQQFSDDVARRAQPVINAYYERRDGSSCIRPITTVTEARHILTGGYNALEVSLRYAGGDKQVVGERVHRDTGPWESDDKRVQWFWWFDSNLFINGEA